MSPSVKAERKRIDAQRVLWVALVVVATLLVGVLFHTITASPTPLREPRKPVCFIHPNIPKAKVCGRKVYHWQNQKWVYMGPLTPFDPAIPEGGR